jgi:hypothetical protein
MWNGPFYEWDIVDLMSEVAVPTQLIFGDSDPYFAREQYENIGKKVKLAQTHMLPFGHLSVGDELTRVNELIVNFVEQQTKLKRDSKF